MSIESSAARIDPSPYPLPPTPQQNAQLPFYGQAQAPLHQQRQQHHDSQRSSPGQDGGTAELSADGTVQEVPDDPALRANLANLIGGLGSFNSNEHHQETPTRQTITTPQSADSTKQSRTKVSRACDECRRKKIRCDVVDEAGSDPCVNCARTSSTCTFSRQPMKRGPSKGYIKELAERLNTLERQVQPSNAATQQEHYEEIQKVQREMAESLRATGPRAGEKRTYTETEMAQDELRARMGAPPADMRGYGHQASRENTVQPFWRHGVVENRLDHAATPFHENDRTLDITSFDWDESVVDEYYRLIHQTFPLLPNNKNRLRQRLSQCPSSLREAFLVALDCLMRTFPTTSLQPNANYAQALKRAAELLAKYPFDNPSTHTNATNLIYLQTLLLMALESDNHGPATIRGQAGPSRAEWLGRAAGVAGQLEINLIHATNQSVLEGDRDSDDRLSRRVWWVLFILDRWHASSTADLLKLPENSIVLHPEDQLLLGESTYHLARLSFIIGHLASILTTTKTPSTDVMAPSNPASSLLGLTLAGEIDRFRESVESVWGSLNLVHLSYHHCHLLIKRLNPTTEPTEMVGHAVKVATVLNSRLTPVTPLNHHFGALASMTLCELCDVPETRAEALKGLEHMVQALGEGRGLAGKLESEGWDGAIREMVVRKRERMLQGASSLDVLADASAGGAAGGVAGGSAGYDPTMLTRYGYLTALGQGMFRTK